MANSNVKVPVNFDDVGIPGFKGIREEKIEKIVPFIGLPVMAINIEALYKNLSGYYKRLKKRRVWDKQNISTVDVIEFYGVMFQNLANCFLTLYKCIQADAQGLKDALAFYQKEFDNLNFTADYWLPGVDETTGLFDGSTRVYGTWTADHVASGKSVKLTSYHSFAFTDGKISGGGDWFDFGGMMNSLAADTEAATEE